MTSRHVTTALDRRASFDEERGSAEAWLCGIARHKLGDQRRRTRRLRRLARRLKVELPALVQDDIDSYQELRGRQAHDTVDDAQIAAAIEALPMLPDPPAGYGSTCAAVADGERRGLVGERVAPAPGAGRTEVIVVQPAGVPAPVLRDATGQTTSLEVHDGIATAIVTRPGTLTVSGHDGHRTLSVRPFEPQGAIVVDCGNGHLVKARSWKETTPDRRPALCARG